MCMLRKVTNLALSYKLQPNTENNPSFQMNSWFFILHNAVQMAVRDRDTSVASISFQQNGTANQIQFSADPRLPMPGMHHDQ